MLAFERTLKQHLVSYRIITSGTCREKLCVEPDPSVGLRVFSLDVVAEDCAAAVMRRPIPLHENKVVVAVDNFRPAWNAWSICQISQHTGMILIAHQYLIHNYMYCPPRKLSLEIARTTLAVFFLVQP